MSDRSQLLKRMISMFWNVAQFCSEIYSEKKSHRKWYCFTMWLQGGRGKRGKRGEITTGKSDLCCQLRDITTRPERSPDTFGDSSSQKRVLTNLASCDVKARPLFMTLTSSGGSCEPSPVLKHLWRSASLCSSAAIPAAASALRAWERIEKSFRKSESKPWFSQVPLQNVHRQLLEKKRPLQLL